MEPRKELSYAHDLLVRALRTHTISLACIAYMQFGFEAVSKYTEDNLKTTREVIALYKRRQIIESEYAKQMGMRFVLFESQCSSACPAGEIGSPRKSKNYTAKFYRRR